MTFAADLVAGFDRDLARGWQAVTDHYRLAVQTDPATPEDTGRLLTGIAYKKRTLPRNGVAEAVLISSARSDEGADYGTILDRSTGRQVFAKDYGHRAFGPFKKPVGGTKFLSSFRVTTAHVGWWDKANSASNWAGSLNEFGRFDL